MSLPTTKDRHLKTLASIPLRSTQLRTFSYNKYSYVQTCVRVHGSFFGLQKKKENLCFEACHILHVQYFCEINKLICSCFLDPAMYGATKKTGKKQG